MFIKNLLIIAFKPLKMDEKTDTISVF